jgi:hypothetical protein
VTKVMVITLYQYAARRSKNIIFCTLEAAHGNIICLFITELQTCIFSAKVMLSQTFLSSTLQTNLNQTNKCTRLLVSIRCLFDPYTYISQIDCHLQGLCIRGLHVLSASPYTIYGFHSKSCLMHVMIQDVNTD